MVAHRAGVAAHQEFGTVGAENKQLADAREAQQRSFKDAARRTLVAIDAADKLATSSDLIYKPIESSAYSEVQRLKFAATTEQQKRTAEQFRTYLASVTISHAAAKAGSDQFAKYWPRARDDRAAAVAAAQI
jgi:hypothetical protein